MVKRRIILRSSGLLTAMICLCFCIPEATNIQMNADEWHSSKTENAKNEEKPVAIVKKWDGIYSGVRKKEEMVIRDNGEWAKIWGEINAKVNPKPHLPEIDFNKKMVLAAFSGNQSTGGYSIAITNVQQEGEELLVTVKETKPAPGTIQAQTVTSPYFLAVVPVAQKIRWLRSDEAQKPR